MTLNYFGYGRELIYYAGLENIKPTDLIDYMINNKSKYPITNELVDTYVETYVSNMWNSEEELQELFDKGFKGLKLHPSGQKFEVDSEDFFWIYEICEKRKLPIYSCHRRCEPDDRD